MSDPVSIFISYSHKDERFMQQLATHLALLRREGVIEAWHDRRIGAGEEWRGVIESELDRSRLVLFLVSADFLASDFCYAEEMEHVLNDHRAGRIRAIPILVRPVDWETSPLGRFQALPKDAKPITKWRDRDDAWRSIAKGIRAAAEAIRTSEREPSPHSSFISAASGSGGVATRGMASSKVTHTRRQKLYADFWMRLVGRVAEQRADWTRRASLEGNIDNWLDFPAGVQGAHYAMSFARARKLRHELYIDGGTPEENQASYERLLANREHIEERYGRTLTWEPLPGRKACRIADYIDGEVDEISRHDEFISWFIDSGDRLRAAFAVDRIAVHEGLRSELDTTAGGLANNAATRVDPSSMPFQELTVRMDALATDLGLAVKIGRTGRNYQPLVREPGVRYVSGVGIYSSGRGAEFNLSPFRDVGKEAVAEELLQRIREVTGVSVTAAQWPAVPCETLLRDWPRARGQLIEPYFRARERLNGTPDASGSLAENREGAADRMAAFFSFHYERDAWRVQQILNMSTIQGQMILNAQDWEAVKRQGDAAIKKWISEQMAYKTAVVVLVGAQTASRPWVRHEIAYAWDKRKPLVGIRIHGLADQSGRTDSLGASPFEQVKLVGGGTLGDFVPLFSPSGSTSQKTYADISNNLTSWIGSAVKRS